MPVQLKGKEHDQQLKRYQWQTFITLYVGFTCFTLVKRSLGYAAAVGIAAGDLTPQLVGSLSSVQSISYASSKFVGGVLCDKFHPVRLMAIGLALCATTNIVFGQMIDTPSILVGLWAMNGICQSPAWPPVALLMTRWFNDKERAAWWS